MVMAPTKSGRGEGVESLVQGMNNQNNPKLKDSPRKRDRPSGPADPHTPKKQKIHDDTDDTIEAAQHGSPGLAAKARHQSLQLQSRKTHPKPNIFEVPGKSPPVRNVPRSSQNANTSPQTTSTVGRKNQKKRKVILKKANTSKTTSPLKNHGVQEPEKNTTTNLNDTIVMSKRLKRREKVKHSIKPNGPRRTSPRKRPDRDIQPHEPSKQNKSGHDEENHMKQGHMGTTQKFDKVRGKSSTDRSKSKNTQASTNIEGSNTAFDENTTTVMPLSDETSDEEQAEALSTVKDGSEVQNGDGVDEIEDGGENGQEAKASAASEDENEAVADTAKVLSTQSSRKRMMAESRNPIEKTSGMSEALDATDFLGCHTWWDKIRKACKADNEPVHTHLQSKTAKKARECENHLLQLYRKIQKARDGGIEKYQSSLDEASDALEEIYEEILQFSNRHWKFSMIGYDVFDHLIFSLVELARAATLAFWKDGIGILEGLHFVIPVLQLSFDVTWRALGKWTITQLPMLEAGARKRVIKVRSNVHRIVESYQRHFTALQQSQNNRALMDKFTTEQEKELEKLDEFLDQRRQLVQRQLQEYLTSSQTQRPSHHAASHHGSDHMGGGSDGRSDDEAISEAFSEEPSVEHTNQCSHDTDYSRPRKPASNDFHLQREPTAEIPGPTPTPWSDEETTALIHGLRRYTGSTRFEDILNAYGSRSDVLNGRDLDELMLQAKFIKQSMALQIYGASSRSWEWLASVPG